MSDRLTDEQIEELERLEREADEWCGPRWEAMGAPDPDLRREAWLRTPMRDDGSATLVALDMAPENAALAAAMRNALPSLLAEVRAARSLSPAPSTTRAPGGDEAECSHCGAGVRVQCEEHEGPHPYVPNECRGAVTDPAPVPAVGDLSDALPAAREVCDLATALIVDVRTEGWESIPGWRLDDLETAVSKVPAEKTPSSPLPSAPTTEDRHE